MCRNVLNLILFSNNHIETLSLLFGRINLSNSKPLSLNKVNGENISQSLIFFQPYQNIYICNNNRQKGLVELPNCKLNFLYRAHYIHIR